LEPDLETTLHKADAVLLLTEWKAYRELDPHVAKTLVSAPRILDGRNILDPAKWRAAGWTYKGLGRP
jgi:UDPglucose 6-dehydrogenase